MSYTRFEWDEAENRSNTRKHGLSLSTAAEVFGQPHLVRLDTQQATRRERERFEKEIGI
jgi:uncharacterized DUF497 family protein